MWGKNSANVTDTDAISLHGTNPQHLIEKILRSKIYNHAYWKEHCFGLTSESLVDKAMELQYVGGTFGGISEPTIFIQLMLKMLQIQPEKEIVVEFIKNEDYKYVRALGAFYLRLTGRPAEVYQYLEPLFNDYRKIRRRLNSGEYAIVHMDELVEELLREDYAFDIALPHLPKRTALEASGLLGGPRRSAIEDELDDEGEEEDEGGAPVEEDAEEGEVTDRKRSVAAPPAPAPAVSHVPRADEAERKGEAERKDEAVRKADREIDYREGERRDRDARERDRDLDPRDRRRDREILAAERDRDLDGRDRERRREVDEWERRDHRYERRYRSPPRRGRSPSEGRHRRGADVRHRYEREAYRGRSRSASGGRERRRRRSPSRSDSYSGSGR